MYGIRFSYPNEQRRASETARAKQELSASLDPHAQTRKNYRYAGAGSREVQPSEIFDNGSHTFMRFPENMTFPSVFAIGPDGGETLVNKTVRGNWLILPAVGRQWRLRSRQGGDVRAQRRLRADRQRQPRRDHEPRRSRGRRDDAWKRPEIRASSRSSSAATCPSPGPRARCGSGPSSGPWSPSAPGPWPRWCSAELSDPAPVEEGEERRPRLRFNVGDYEVPTFAPPAPEPVPEPARVEVPRAAGDALRPRAPAAGAARRAIRCPRAAAADPAEPAPTVEPVETPEEIARKRRLAAPLGGSAADRPARLAARQGRAPSATAEASTCP